MTSEDQPGQPTQDDHDPVEETQGLDDLFSGSRRKSRSPRGKRKSRWIGIGLSLAVLAGVAAAIVAITTTGTHQVAASSSAQPGANGWHARVREWWRGSERQQPGEGRSGHTRQARPRGRSAQPAEESAKPGHQLALRSRRYPADRRVERAWHCIAGSWRPAVSPMRHACAQLAASVATAKAGPPIPIATMQEVYAKALSELAKGAAACNSAISVKSGDESVEIHLDSSLLHQSVSELSVGATDVFRSTAEIEIISRQHH